MPAALVTGASSGIGRALAADLLAAGWDVSAVSRDPARGALEGAFEIACDVTDESACEAAVRGHLDRFGRLDLVIGCAGVGIARRTERVSAREWDLQLAVNLRGLFTIVREALPALRESRGLIVALSSVAGLRGLPGLAAYGASKHAVIGLVRSLNAELAGTGVRATAICPELVDTPMTAWARDQVPQNRMIGVDDIAATLRMLLELSPGVVVPEIVLERAEALGAPWP